VPIVVKAGILNLLEPSGPVKAVMGLIALPFTSFKMAATKSILKIELKR
jgi:hypothetical protein